MDILISNSSYQYISRRTKVKPGTGEIFAGNLPSMLLYSKSERLFWSRFKCSKERHNPVNIYSMTCTRAEMHGRHLPSEEKSQALQFKQQMIRTKSPMQGPRGLERNSLEKKKKKKKSYSVSSQSSLDQWRLEMIDFKKWSPTVTLWTKKKGEH